MEVFPVTLEMRCNPSGGLVDMEPILLRRDEKLHCLENPVGSTNTPKQEMVVASAVQMFPKLNL
jgi:hypothetical protein